VNKTQEWVDLRSLGLVNQDLSGWVLASENSGTSCDLPPVELAPYQILRVWTREEDAGPNDASCGLDDEMWSDTEPDTAVLYDGEGREIDRFP